MTDEEFIKETIAKELSILIRAGLVEVYISEDGEWLYQASEKAKSLTDIEKIALINAVEPY